MKSESNNNFELNSLLNNNNNKNINKMASNATDSYSSRSKNSSETILIEKDFKNVNSDPSMRANPSSSLLLDEAGNQTQNSNIDVEIVEPKKIKKKNVVNNNQQPPSQPQMTANDENIEEIEEELELKYGAAHVIKLFVPVTICLLFVIISLNLITSYQKSGGNTLYIKIK